MENEISANRWSILLITLLAAFLMPFMGSSINIALPSIGKEFNLDAILLSWVATAFILSVAVCLIPFGRIADIHGRKRIFILGIIIYTLGSTLAGFSVSAAMLIASRALQGIGSAMFSATALAILTSVFPKEQRGKVLGISVAAVYLGLSLGPPLGGLITQHLDWRAIFLINIPLCLIILVLALWKISGEWTDAKGERFDFIGSVVYGLMLISLMYGFSLLPGIAGAAFIASSVLLSVLFVRREIRIQHPILNIAIFRNNTVFIFSNLAALINYSATFGVGFLLSLYLQYIRGFSPASAGMVLIAQPIIMTAFSPFAGMLSDRIEPRMVSSIGMALTVAGLFLLSFLNGASNLIFIVACLVILGSGFALFSSPNTNAVMSSVDRKTYGIASAMLGTMRLLGQMFSLGVVTLLFALYLGRVEITPEYYPMFLSCMKTAFLVFAIICFVGVFASLARGKVRNNYVCSNSEK
ncbi:MAG: MFS transporter [Planctomycetes bacterium]|nr:MFS transporter [Planctomycetota bacterium]